MFQLLIPIIIGKLGGLHAEELLDLVLDPLGNNGGKDLQLSKVLFDTNSSHFNFHLIEEEPEVVIVPLD